MVGGGLLFMACATSTSPAGAPRVGNVGDGPSAPARTVLRLAGNCADIRGGISGYLVFEVVDGSDRKAFYHYGGSVAGAPFDSVQGTWFVAEVSDVAVTLPTEGWWPNQCEPAFYAGQVTTLLPGYADEATARRAVSSGRR